MNPLQDRLNEIVRQRADAARVLRENGGRGVELAEMIDRLDREIAALEGATLLACPQCTEHDGLADVTMYPGLCDGTFARQADGTLDFSGDGETEVCWDSGKAPENGHTVQCDCGWTGKSDDLIEYIELVDEADTEFQCEDCNVNGLDCLTHGKAARAAMIAVHNDPGRTFAVLTAAGLLPKEDA